MKIILYGGDFCPYCHKAKEFLEENNIEFEYVDVQEDHKGNKECLDPLF